jgi:hypothetical protein
MLPSGSSAILCDARRAVAAHTIRLAPIGDPVTQWVTEAVSVGLGPATLTSYAIRAA